MIGYAEGGRKRFVWEFLNAVENQLSNPALQPRKLHFRASDQLDSTELGISLTPANLVSGR